MKTQLKKVDRHKRELSVEVGTEIVNRKFDDVYVRIGQEAKVPGFRPGKAPRDILEKHYKESASQQVIKELIPEAYSDAVKKEALDVISCMEIRDVKLDNSTLTFKALLELKPQIDFKKDYKGIKVDYKDIQVPEDEVKRTLDSLKESRKIDNIDDSFARTLGYPKVKELEEAIKRQVYMQKESSQRVKIEEDIIKYLLENTDFETPASLIEQQLQELMERQKIDLALKGVSKDKIEEQVDTLKKDLRPLAEKQVRIYLVFDEIAKKENILLDKDTSQRAMEFLLKEADWKESS
jgi:FKBP-type peptidyl-prolyl cis-trans isomerase (trigger factor)